MKINNKKGNLGDDININVRGNKEVIISTRIKVAKRYLKYLTKKFLKKIQILDFIKV